MSFGTDPCAIRVFLEALQFSKQELSPSTPELKGKSNSDHMEA